MHRFLPGITQPKDTDFLWRYMSFEKFVSLLSTKSLFFTRADKFEDPFEGFMPPSVKSVYESEANDIKSNDLGKSIAKWRKYILCSCWHHGNEESAAMWEKYHMNNSGIAIKTTVGNFKNCLGEGYNVFIGKIKYINHYEYEVQQSLPEKSIYTWYFHKREPFEYEREFRAIIAHYPSFLRDFIDSDGHLINPETILNREFPDICEIGIPFDIDVNTLIGEVITSPYIDGWVADTIRSVVKQYGFGFDVHPSPLLKEPSDTV